MPGSKAQVVVLAREDREKLERIERAATSEQREVLRARILLQAAEAASNEAISTSSIGRILSRAELKPQRYRMRLHSPDPEFARKVREAVGLYLAPPRPDQVVLCIDEKTGMQALRRRFAARQPRPGKAGRWEFEYRRHGTRTLLAAFNVHTGHVLGRCGPRRRAEDLLGFLEDVAAYCPTQRVDVVWDNFNIHSGRRWEEFNAQHSNRFHFHHTPIHASWVNQAELWFGILQRRVLRRASFRDAAELVERVEAFIHRWNEMERRPFRRTFTGYLVQAGLPKVA